MPGKGNAGGSILHLVAVSINFYWLCKIIFVTVFRFVFVCILTADMEVISVLFVEF